MRIFNIDRVDELETIISEFGKDVLYRGQTKAYGSEEAPVISSSFSRQGCIPSEMLQWSHYARLALAYALATPSVHVSMEWTQALLQHYGWRSFFIDATTDATVACWFASHVYAEEKTFELVEDCFEADISLTRKRASYNFNDGIGVLYVLSKPVLEQQFGNLFDLSNINVDDCSVRYTQQSAWLVGPLKGNLPVDCILATIHAPRSVFRDFSQVGGTITTNDLFPGPDKDPILQFLISSPWFELNTNSDIFRIFRQQLELPYYNWEFKKMQPPETAFYSNTMASSHYPDDGQFVFYKIPDLIITGSPDQTQTKLPYLYSLVQSHNGTTIFEVDNLFRHPNSIGTEYSKGIAITNKGNGLVAISEFTMKHPGLTMAGFGINMPWHYQVNSEGEWIRTETKNDCPCNNYLAHQHQFSSLTILEQHLSDPELRKAIKFSPHQNANPSNQNS